MKKILSLSPPLAAFFLSVGGLAGLDATRAWAQQPGNIFPVANAPGLLDPAPTPAASTDTPANVEAPPPANPNGTTETEILATNGANFSSKDRIAIFEGDVRVNDPRFQLACDKLTVYLAKGATGEGGATPANGSKPPKPAAGQDAAGSPSTPGGGIDHAFAEGHVIIIQKRPPAKPGEEAKISMGRAERADFDNKTGDMVLRGTPSVEQNGNVHMALAPTTIITLHRDNSMTTVGPVRTVIKGKASSVDVPGSTPGGAAKPTDKSGKKRPKGSAATAG